jgi:hypothetical protein
VCMCQTNNYTVAVYLIDVGDQRTSRSRDGTPASYLQGPGFKS